MERNNMQEILGLIAKAQKAPLPEALQKSWVQSSSSTSGLTAYDLENGAKHLFPVLSPLRNTTPRVGGGIGTAVNWRAVTGINTGFMEIGVSEGNRGGVMAHTTADYTAAYRGIGLEDYVTFEADYAGRTFEDIKAESVRDLLAATMIAEEIVILGGNTSLALGTTPTPTLAASASGGTLATATYSVICVALSMNGFYTGSVANGIRASVTRTNADGSTDTYGGGSAQKSASATVAVTGPTGSMTAVCNSAAGGVNGALGYAWFWGAAGAEVLGAVTTLNSIIITATATGTQTAASLPASDNSRNALVFDGYLTQVFTPGSNSYILRMPTGTAGVGTWLTSDNAGGIVEWDTLLQSLWDNYKVSPDEIWISSRDQKGLQKLILTGNGANSAQRFVFNATQGKLTGGSIMLSYLNKFGMSAGAGPEYGQGTELPIHIHPNMPPGTMWFRTKQLPYKLNNVPNVAQIKTRQEYYQLEWPLRTRRYEYGVYADEVLQTYFPPAFGVITNLGPPL